MPVTVVRATFQTLSKADVRVMRVEAVIFQVGTDSAKVMKLVCLYLDSMTGEMREKLFEDITEKLSGVDFN